MGHAMISVLIAAEDKMVLKEIKSILARRKDMRVVAAADEGLRAATLAARHNPDVAIVSVALTDPDAAATVRMIRHWQSGCRVICIGSSPDISTMRNLFAAGAVGHLCDDCLAPHIVAAIREVMSGTTYVGPHTQQMVCEDYSKIVSCKDTPPLWSLTSHERKILTLLAEGTPVAKIAAAIGIAPKAVKAYRKGIMDKLGLHP
jgi:two-component system invasion response regulator UvrY